MVREKRITIRLSENEYVKLQEEVSKKGITISDYLRNRLFNEPQSPYYEQQMDLQALKMELLDFRYFIERLPNIKKSNREYMQERIENIWLMLK